MADITNRDLNGIQRAMAWERAKGELNSMLQSYIRDGDKYANMKTAIGLFVKHVEENGLAE